MTSDYDFEPTNRPNEPLFSFNWTDTLIILGFALFFAGILFDIVKHS